MRYRTVAILALGCLLALPSFAQGRVPDRGPEWPIYHVSALPDEGVACPYDSNGCIYWKGKYHLMYIFQDRTRPSDGHCWGHLVSEDLVNWTFLPPALIPEKGDADIGTFSGNAFINKDGVPMLCWFGIEAGVCVATAQDDELITWQKHPRNPIIPMPKKEGDPGFGVYKVWDPYLWLENGTYYCLLGGNELPNKKDTLYTCKSTDLVNWEFMGPFYEHPDLSWTVEGEDCSCPDFFKLGDKRVLLCISHKIGGRCYVGRYENEKFVPEQHVRMNWPGGTFFAPESLEAPDGRRIFWAWVTDPRVRPSQDKAGSGYQSLPRVLALGEDGGVRITPAAELQSLRRHERKLDTLALPEGKEVPLAGVRGECMEIALEIEPGTAGEVGVKLRCSGDGKEYTTVTWFPAQKKMRLDMAHSTLRNDVVYGTPPHQAYFLKKAGDHENRATSFDAPLDLPAGEPLRLRIFLDRPLIEVFANDRQCLTQIVFPKNRDATQIKLFANGGDATMRAATAWDMAPASFVNNKHEAK